MPQPPCPPSIAWGYPWSCSSHCCSPAIATLNFLSSVDTNKLAKLQTFWKAIVFHRYWYFHKSPGSLGFTGHRKLRETPQVFKEINKFWQWAFQELGKAHAKHSLEVCKLLVSSIAYKTGRMSNKVRYSAKDGQGKVEELPQWLSCSSLSHLNRSSFHTMKRS